LARKIVLADDSVTAQNMGRKILADAGYEVVTVNNGSAALKKILEIKPDLVILDVYMPGYSGLEVCQRLKETPDSSRVPVLLTVGKLEPFKPEEAQRVRAEAFIVKPFEASELLSALSKLEDKVVPRSENAKPGRFARAFASAEESSRGRIEPIDGGDDNGWKSRINFPHKKSEREEKVEDDPSIYNAINRDLRTVVATPAERMQEKKEEKREEKRLQEIAAERGIDVAAVAPPGAPQDVTPEEVAAIAAAAAQIQALHATLEEEGASGKDVPASDVSGQPIVAAAEATPAQQDELPPSVQPAAAEAAEHPISAEAQEVPMTMAAASSAGSRWTAVSVALTADEANISLDMEMQKTYAAFMAEQSVSPVAEPEAAPQSFAIAGEAAPEQVAVSSSHEIPPEPAPEPRVDSVVVAESQLPETFPAMPQEQAGSSVSSEPLASEPVASSEVAESFPQPEYDYSQPALVGTPEDIQSEPAASQLTEAVPAAAEESRFVTEPTPEPVALAAQDQPSPAQIEPELMAPPISAPFTSFASSESPASQEQHLEERHQVEAAKNEVESVKSTAAAWASWRQIRDSRSNEAQPDAERTQQPERAASGSLPAEAAAMAVAAGAEQAAQEGDRPPSENPADVASIVDSVLADLRPRLMAEISRKMAEKK